LADISLPAARSFGDYQPVTSSGYVQMASLSSASGLTSIPTGAKAALLQAETQDVRVRFDGTNPTGATNGFLLTKVTDKLFYAGDLSKIKVLETAASAKLNVQYYQ
jgi:hypothetical protein